MEGIDKDAPPPYVEFDDRESASDHRSQLLQCISLLPAVVLQSQREYKSEQDKQDLDHIARLVPEVKAFLTYIATLPQQPSQAELVMVPEHIVSDNWTLSDSDEQRKEGNAVRVARIRAQAAKSSDTKTGSDAPSRARGSAAKNGEGEFDEWGRWPEPSGESAASGSGSAQSWWWRDEDMARRLAADLLPPNVHDGKIASPSVLVATEDAPKATEKSLDHGCPGPRTESGPLCLLRQS